MSLKKKKIAVVCPHQIDIAPGQRLKYEQYFKDWENNNWDITVLPFNDTKLQAIIYKKGFFVAKVLGVLRGYINRIKLLFKLKKYDVVYVFLWVTPFGFPVFERLYAKFSKKLIYDIDDAIFLSNSSEYNSIVGKLKGKTKPFSLMKNAAHVITCTPFLDEIARKYNQKTTDISSTINTDTYQAVNHYKNDHTLVLGWSGSHSTSKYLYLLKDVLIKLNQDYPFKLLVMGDAKFNIEGIDVEALAWSEEIEISTLQRFDIGLYPLPNEQWVLGKSGLKALQYMAVGLPVVATAIGANYRVISDEETGFLVNTEEEWLLALKKLIGNGALRESFGKNGRAKVESSYSIKATAPIYLKIINELTKT